MGDFAGGTLKYLRRHPIARLTLAGGFGKLAKLASGHLDLHSARSRIDIALARRAPRRGRRAAGERRAPRAGGRRRRGAGDRAEAAPRCAGRSPSWSPARAREVALATLAGAIKVDVAVFDRTGALIGHADPRAAESPRADACLDLSAAPARRRSWRAPCVERFGDGVAVTTSLAGRTARPLRRFRATCGSAASAAPRGCARIFASKRIDLVIDATHPFADQIVAARAAGLRGDRGVPRLMLLRPMWQRHPLDRWIEVADLAGAAAVVGQIGRRAWLTVGAGELDAFAQVTDVRFLVRSIHAPATPLPLQISRGACSDAGRSLCSRSSMSCSAMPSTCWSARRAAAPPREAKLVAAREASLPVIMVRRPPAEPGEAVTSVAETLDWLDACLVRIAATIRGKSP